MGLSLLLRGHLVFFPSIFPLSWPRASLLSPLNTVNGQNSFRSPEKVKLPLSSYLFLFPLPYSGLYLVSQRFRFKSLRRKGGGEQRRETERGEQTDRWREGQTDRQMKRGTNRQTDEERAARNLEAQRKEAAKAGAFDRPWTTKEVHSVMFKITPSPSSSCIYKLRVEVNCFAFLSWTPSQGSQRIKALLPHSTNAYVPLLQSLFDLSWDISTLPLIIQFLDKREQICTL